MKAFIVLISFLLSTYGTNMLLQKFAIKFTNTEVLSANTESVQSTSTPTPSPPPTPTLTLTPTPTMIPTPTLSPTPTPIPQPEFTSEQINGFIERFAAQYGINPHVLRGLAVCESGFNPKAINGPYAGLFQFGSNTWKYNRVLMGEDANVDLRFNAEESTQTAAYMISSGKGNAWPNCPH